jgi:hypothetical protein
VTGIEKSTCQVLRACARFHANETSPTDADEVHELLSVQSFTKHRLASRIQAYDMEPHFANVDTESRNLHDDLPRIAVATGAAIIDRPKSGADHPVTSDRLVGRAVQAPTSLSPLMSFYPSSVAALAHERVFEDAFLRVGDVRQRFSKIGPPMNWNEPFGN